MDKQLQKLIELSNKTGDRLIAFDPSNKHSAYVVMGVDDYEKLAVGMSEVRGLTEDELLDKINRDIAIWKSDKIDDNILTKANKNYALDEDFDDEFDRRYDSRFSIAPTDRQETSRDEDWYSINDIAQKTGYTTSNDEEAEVKKGGAWSIPSDRKEKAEEIIEEDRYYLEDIED